MIPNPDDISQHPDLVELGAKVISVPAFMSLAEVTAKISEYEALAADSTADVVARFTAKAYVEGAKFVLSAVRQALRSELAS
ncbi:hypothetical protein FDG2_0123 [Candidatus Protofrankia californiensis]|uniref:Uncharacterized protein n=1 Tax=Candidatus Protofrankia californiensis TaxID=1839754 RepID=A0A1C3NSX3_9ACTN|nr:hypothetical protein FDG2_0123 [Candidatus Protofrankia californiensis]